MDSAISTAARALSVADPLTALKFVALRSDAPALALRGIAMAQLGELSHAKALFRRAIRKFGPSEPVARARCVIAQAEVNLALRDLAGAERGLDEAAKLLNQRGDWSNAAFARLVQVRRLTLLGEVAQAERVLGGLSSSRTPARLAALVELAGADLAIRRADCSKAESCLRRARAAAHEARLLPVLAEVDKAELRLQTPVARVREGSMLRPILLGELPELWGSGKLVVDACRREARLRGSVVDLVTRPIPFELLLALADAHPGDIPREALITRAFGARRVNESHRARLRVEVGRLRRLVARVAEVRATRVGYELRAKGDVGCSVLLPPTDGDASELLALLSGGEAWATSALAAAVRKSQRHVQRALSALEGDGKVRSTGAGRARRWVAAPSAGFTTTMLLVAPDPMG